MLNVSGLTVGQQYAMALYCLYPGSTSYTQVDRQPSSGTVASGATVWSFNISGYVAAAGTYQFYVHIYAPGQTPQNSDTNTVSYTTQAQTVRVLVRNYLDGSTALASGSFEGSEGGIFYITYAGTQYQTYSVEYEFQYFTISSNNYLYQYSADTPITIASGLEIHAYYKTRIVYHTVTGYCGTGVASFRMSSSGGAYTTVTSGSAGSITVAAGETVSFTQLTPMEDYGAPYSLYYNREGQSGWFGPASSFNITDTSFDRRIMIQATELPKPVAPTITGVSVTKDSATVAWSANGGNATDGYWTLFYRTSAGAYVSYGTVSTSPVTVAGLSPGTTYYFMIRHTIRSTAKYADSASVSATTKALIAAFAWTSNDAANIAAGSLISKITAAAWNTLRQRVADCGGTAASVPTATAGAALSTNHFNQMRAAIAALSGAGTVTPAVVVSELPTYRAAQFANDNAALKEAINRAITAKNAS